MTETITLFDLNARFTGRNVPGFPGDYHPDRLYRIHPRNRAEVWKREDRQKLLESIVRRRYIPPIITHEVVDNSRIHRDILDGGNRVSAIRRILHGGEFELSEEDRRAVERYQIVVVVLRDLSPNEIRTQFRLLNRVVKVSHGVLYHMSTEDSPIITYAADIMANPENPLRPRILDLFSPTVLADNASRGTLANVVAMCAAAQHGVHHITTSFDVNESILTDRIDQQLVETRLGLVFTAIARANDRMPVGWVVDARVAKGEFNVGRYIGVILYDLMPHGVPGQASYEPAPVDTDTVLNKWARLIADVRQGIPVATLAVTVPGAQNLTVRKLRKISKQVDFYLRQNRMPTETELADIMRAPVGGDADSVRDDDDEESV
jgi:hypothetical protein